MVLNHWDFENVRHTLKNILKFRSLIKVDKFRCFKEKRFKMKYFRNVLKMFRLKSATFTQSQHFNL